MKVIGIDYSLSNIAFSIFENRKNKLYGILKTKTTFKNKEKGKKSYIELLYNRMLIGEQIYIFFKKILIQNKPIIIGIEGYSFGGSKLSVQAEIMGIFNIVFIKYKKMMKEKFNTDVFLLVIPPTSLKKYVTGKGIAPKQLVLKEVYKKYNFDTDDDNIADAFVLGKMTSEVLYNLFNNKYHETLTKNEKETLKKLILFQEKN